MNESAMGYICFGGSLNGQYRVPDKVSVIIEGEDGEKYCLTELPAGVTFWRQISQSYDDAIKMLFALAHSATVLPRQPISLPELIERMRQLTRDTIIDAGTEGYTKGRESAAKKLSGWFAERGISLVDLTYDRT